MYKPSPSPAVAISGYQKAILERLTEALQTGDASLSDPGSVAEAVGISRKEISAAFGCEGGMVLPLPGTTHLSSLHRCALVRQRLT